MNSGAQHEKFIRLAIELASSQLDKSDGRPFGAVVVKDNQILGASFNRAVMDHDPTAHAELLAIREACRKSQYYRIEGAVIYSSCEPCPMCLGAIYWSGIETLYYGCSSAKAEEFGFGDTLLYHEVCDEKEQRKVKSYQLLEQEALSSFVEWSRKGGQSASLQNWK